MDRILDFTDFWLLVPLVQNSLLASLILGLMGGLIGVFVMQRDLSFAVHGLSELAFAGAAVALLVGIDIVLGSVLGSLAAAVLLAVLGARARDRNSIVGVLMPFGLGIGILALALYEGRAANKFGLLTGQIVAVDDPKLVVLAVLAAVVIVGLLVIWRPLSFASLDPEVAVARAVPTRWLSLGFLLLLALAVAATVQVIGALLVLALLVTPAAAALRVTSSMLWAPLLSAGIAIFSLLGGILLALGGGLPISPYVTTLAFLCYLIARLVSRIRAKRDRVRE